MTKAANLANLAAETNYGILQPSRGGTGLGSFDTTGAMYAVSTTELAFGTLPVLAGGIGANTIANNALIVGRGFNPIDTISPGSANNVLMSDGTKWYAANATTRGIGIIPKPATYGNILLDIGNDWISQPTNNLIFTTPGISGNILTSNGTSWISQAPIVGGTVTSITPGSGISVSHTTGAITVTNSGVRSFMGRTGAVLLTSNDIVNTIAEDAYVPNSYSSDYAESSNNATRAITAYNALSFSTANYSFVQSGTKLYVKFDGNNIASFDANGNFICTGTVTAGGTP